MVLTLEQSWDLLDGNIDGSNDGKLESLLLGDSLGFTDGKVIGSDEGIKMGSTECKWLSTIIEMFTKSHLGLMLEQS